MSCPSPPEEFVKKDRDQDGIPNLYYYYDRHVTFLTAAATRPNVNQ